MKHTNKHEIIDAQDVHIHEKSNWSTGTSRFASKGKKTIAVCAVGALLLAAGGWIAAEIYENRLDAMEDKMEQQLRQQTAIINQKKGNQGVLTQESSAASNVVASSTTAATTASTTIPAIQARSAYGVTLVESSELDGTYTAQVGYDSYVLTVKGNQATLLEVERDGDQSLEEVIFDLDKKIAYVDGDVEHYTFDGQTLTLTEVDRNIFDQDQIVFTKQ